MSALSEIQREIDRHIERAQSTAARSLTSDEKRLAKTRCMQVRVGKSAEHSILAVTGDEKLPETIDDVPLVTTEAFDGFEVVVL